MWENFLNLIGVSNERKTTSIVETIIKLDSKTIYRKLDKLQNQIETHRPTRKKLELR